MAAFLTALMLVFAAEFGDKTQLVAMAFATRFRPSIVLAAIALASLLLHLTSVTIGQTVGAVLPTTQLNVLAGLAFIAFGVSTVWSAKNAKDDDEERFTKYSPFITVLLTFSIAELGDKTMLTSITVASQQHDFIGVWLGATAGMILSSALGIWVGHLMRGRLQHTAIRMVSAVLFVVTGIVTLAHTAIAH